MPLPPPASTSSPARPRKPIAYGLIACMVAIVAYVASGFHTVMQAQQIERLMKNFGAGHGGIAGYTASPGEELFASMLHYPNAAMGCWHLLRSTSVPVQLMGLRGLHQLRDPQLAFAAKPLLASPQKVSASYGCIMDEERVCLMVSKLTGLPPSPDMQMLLYRDAICGGNTFYWQTNSPAGFENPESAIRHFIAQPNAEALCEELTAAAAPVARLYGLLGLKLINSPRLKRAYELLEHDSASLRVYVGKSGRKPMSVGTAAVWVMLHAQLHTSSPPPVVVQPVPDLAAQIGKSISNLPLNDLQAQYALKVVFESNTVYWQTTTTSLGEKLTRTHILGEHGRQRCEELLTSPCPAARLYGLLGLKILHPLTAQRAAEQLTQDPALVWTYFGRNGKKATTVQDATNWIMRNSLD